MTPARRAPVPMSPTAYQVLLTLGDDALASAWYRAKLDAVSRS